MDKKEKNTALLGFLITTSIPSLLLIVAVYFGIHNIYQQYSSTEDELKGAEVISHLFHLDSDYQIIRGLHQIHLYAPHIDINEQLAAYQKDVELDITSDWSELIEYFELKTEMNSLLQLTRETLSIDYDIAPKELFRRHTELINNTNTLILYVADKSGLILDPVLDTYYLMDITVTQIPQLTESIAQIRGYGSMMLAKRSIDEIDRHILLQQIAITNNLIERLLRSKEVIEKTSPSILPLINIELAAYNNEVTSFLDNCNTYPCPLEAEISAKEFFDETTSIITGFQEIFHESSSLLREKLTQRMETQFSQLITTLVASMFTVFIISLIALYYYRQQMNAYQRIEKISLTDPLTLIPNRRSLPKIFNREINRAKRDHKGFVFGVLDVDWFKQYNDHYGHQMGDVALQEVARSLAMSLRRAGDFYFRYGGEEFCFLFSTTSETDPATISENIIQSIQDKKIIHKSSPSYGVITASIGMAHVIHVNDESIDTMIKQADIMLYKAKDNGRNRCECITIMPDNTAPSPLAMQD